MTTKRAEKTLLVVFVDLTRFMAQSQRVNDLDLAETLDAYYEQIAVAAEAAGGITVKFFGDGGLLVFEESAIERGIQGLLELKESVDGLMARRGWDCRLTVKAHVGSVLAGDFGAPGAKHFDVLGKAVNTAATLNGTGVTLSVAAFRKLGPALRHRFRKHTASVTYIAQEDRRPRG